jgi:hypothetical protein
MIELYEQLLDSLPEDSVTGEEEPARGWQMVSAALAAALLGSGVWFLVR